MFRLILGYTILTLGAAYGVFLVTSPGWAFIILGFLTYCSGVRLLQRRF